MNLTTLFRAIGFYWMTWGFIDLGGALSRFVEDILGVAPARNDHTAASYFISAWPLMATGLICLLSAKRIARSVEEEDSVSP